MQVGMVNGEAWKTFLIDWSVKEKSPDLFLCGTTYSFGIFAGSIFNAKLILVSDNKINNKAPNTSN